MLYIIAKTCDAYLESRGAAIMETWGTSPNMKLVFAGDEDRVINGFEQINGLHPPGAHPPLTESRYDDGTVKLFNSIRWAAKQEDLRWAFFCDDDIYLKVDRLRRYITTLNARFNGCFGKDLEGNWPEDRNIAYPSGGAGFLLSKQVICQILPHLESAPITKPYYGDVMLGYVLRRANVRIIDHGVFFDQSESDEWKEWQWGNGKRTPAISYHYMTPKRMRDLHTVLTTEKEKCWVEESK